LTASEEKKGKRPCHGMVHSLSPSMLDWKRGKGKREEAGVRRVISTKRREKKKRAIFVEEKASILL